MSPLFSSSTEGGGMLSIELFVSKEGHYGPTADIAVDQPDIISSAY